MVIVESRRRLGARRKSSRFESLIILSTDEMSLVHGRRESLESPLAKFHCLEARFY